MREINQGLIPIVNFQVNLENLNFDYDMSEIRNLTRNGETFYPLTHVDAIINRSGNTGIDSEPIPGSYNLIESGGVFAEIGSNGICTPMIYQGMYDNSGNPIIDNIYSIRTEKIPFEYININVSNGTCIAYVYKKDGTFLRKSSQLSNVEITRQGEDYYVAIAFFNQGVTEIHPNDYSSLNVTIILKEGIKNEIQKINSDLININQTIGEDIKIEQGLYNDLTGEPIDDSLSIYGIRTPLMRFEYFKIWTTTNSDGQYCGLLYNENKEFLGRLGDITYHRGIDVLCSDNSVKYISFYFVNAGVTAITPQDFNSLNIKLYLYSGIRSGMKKKISCLGDSITLGYGDAQSYPIFLASYYDSINLGITGSEWSGSTETAFWRRIENISTDSDIISIMGGTNDWLHSCALGTVNDTSSTKEISFYGALKYTSEYLINNFPNSKLCFITPIKCKDNAFSQVENGLNSLGKSLRDYSQAIVDVGKIYSIPILDLNILCNIDPNYQSHYSLYYQGDGCHPNSVGNERIFNKIFSFIKSL